MSIDWNAPYIDRRIWILDHLESLQVNCEEGMVLLLVDYMNMIHHPISHEALSEKTKLSIDQIEDIFISLSDKGYLTTEFKNGTLSFHISGVFDQSRQGMPVQRSLIEQFEYEFKRTLNPSEMDHILQMADVYDQRLVIKALDLSVAYKKVNLQYIESILANWKSEGITVEDMEDGKQ